MTRLALFALAIIALSSVISTDAAFAAAKKTSNNTGPTVDRVLAACDAIVKRGGNCGYTVNSGGNISGCSDHACFVCFQDRSCLGITK